MTLHRYATAGDIPGVQQELDRGVSIDATDPTTDSQFYPATALNQALASPKAGVAMVQFLLDRGATIDLTPPPGLSGNISMVFALRSGDLAKVQLLLDYGATLDYPVGDDDDALAEAVQSKADGEAYDTLIQFVLDRGPRLQGNYGQTALIILSERGKFAWVQQLLAVGAAAESLGWDNLMRAIALGTLSEVEQCLSQSPDLTRRDSLERTPWLLSLQTGDVTKAQSLLAAGCDPTVLGIYQKPPLFFALESRHLEMVSWLLDPIAGPQPPCDVNQADTYGTTALQLAVYLDWLAGAERLLQAGVDPGQRDTDGYPARLEPQSIAMAELLMAHSDELGYLWQNLFRQYTQVPEPLDWSITRADYERDRSPHFGQANPQAMDLPFWREMVRWDFWAYGARQHFEDSPFQNRVIAPNSYAGKAVWCFSRNGQSFTRLPTGQIVAIAGEHEDGYDPDFCIYNDVVVYDGRGDFQIYGYPREVFPPTDFHSATLVEGFIYVLGNLGYTSDRRLGHTPVYRLNCTTWAMEEVQTTGESPGWISRHRAKLQYTANGTPEIKVEGGNIWRMGELKPEYVDHHGSYVLDLGQLQWRSFQGFSSKTISS